MNAVTGARQQRAGVFSRRGWLVVVLVTLGVFLPQLRNDFVDWDDLNMIVHNPLFNPPSWTGAGWYWVHPAWNLYQPVTTTVWAALAWAGWVQSPDHFGGHMNPAVFHLAGALTHALAVGCLFQILLRILKNQAAAVIGALVFALHPLQVEPVAFAGAMNGPLSGCFLLLAIGQYLAGVDPQTDLPPWKREIRLAVSTLALLLAMLARPSAVVGAPIAVAIDRAAFARTYQQIARSIIPWVILTLACVIWTHQFQQGDEAAKSPIWFRPIVACDALMFYIGKILLPIHLCIEYDRTPTLIRQMRYVAFTPLAPFALVVIAVLCRQRKPLLSAAIAIFMVALLPSSGLVPFDWERVSTVADRYASLSLIGVGLAVGVLVAELPRLMLPSIAILMLFAVATEYQITTWKDGPTLYRHVLSINPDAWYSMGNLGYAIGDESPRQAIDLCKRSINLNPQQADVWNTLGSILMGQKRKSEAILAFEMAHELAPTEPLFRDNLLRAQNGAEDVELEAQGRLGLP